MLTYDVPILKPSLVENGRFFHALITSKPRSQFTP